MSDSKYILKLVHLYPQQMNIYGDMGNIITLQKRCQWRNINLEVENLGFGKPKQDLNGDIYFMGGGQDNDMYKVFDDMLKTKKEYLRKEVDNEKVFLLICGGFQLFGEYFLDAQGREIKGLGILPVSTKAPGDQLKQRCLGNIIAEMSEDLESQINVYYPGKSSKYIVGFENHSGQTFINNDLAKPLSQTVQGFGNNSTEKVEGSRFKNIFASYIHGSLLPKNPHLADLIIGLALKNKYNRKIELEQLDDSIEWRAHKSILKRYQKSISA